MSTLKAVVVLPYEPPEREFSDAILAFRDFELATTWAVRIEPDPLGPVNRIVKLMHGRHRVGLALYPIRAGSEVRLVRDEGGYSIEELFAARDAQWRTEYGKRVATVHVPFRVPGWRVEVDGRTVLTVPDEHTPYVVPRVPLRRRLRSWATKRARSAADGAAGRLGYHREGECGGDW